MAGVIGNAWTVRKTVHIAKRKDKNVLMPISVHVPIANALAALRADRDRLDRQIDALQGALDALTSDGARALARGAKPGPAAKARKKRKPRIPLTAAQRKAIGARMKASWAKRRRVGA